MSERPELPLSPGLGQIRCVREIAELSQQHDVLNGCVDLLPALTLPNFRATNQRVDHEQHPEMLYETSAPSWIFAWKAEKNLSDMWNKLQESKSVHMRSWFQVQ